MPLQKTLRYVGHQRYEDLPFKEGDEIIIPKGVQLTCGERSKVVRNVSEKKVRVCLVRAGFNVPIREAMQHWKNNISPEFLAELEEQKVSDPAGYHARMVPVSNPSVMFVTGSGLYRTADINDLLEANGRA